MTFLLLVLFIPTSHAVVLSRNISKPEGSSEQRFELTQENAKYFKASNFFDQKKDFSLGIFELESVKSSAEDLKKIEGVLEKVKTADAFLKKKNSSFNDLSVVGPHESFIYLNDYRIAQSSDLYSDLKEIFMRLQGLDWKLQNGIRLTADHKYISNIKTGKEGPKKPFNFRTFCDQASTPALCNFKGLGILYVE